jgi:hypothetical protein
MAVRGDQHLSWSRSRTFGFTRCRLQLIGSGQIRLLLAPSIRRLHAQVTEDSYRENGGIAISE